MFAIIALIVAITADGIESRLAREQERSFSLVHLGGGSIKPGIRNLE